MSELTLDSSGRWPPCDPVSGCMEMTDVDNLPLPYSRESSEQSVGLLRQA